MKYNFDEIVNRKDTSSVKWDILTEEFGSEEVLPMWVADMDFRVAPEISEAVAKRAEHDVYGYTVRSSSYFESVRYWLKTRHNWDIDIDMILNLPGVVPSLAISILTLTEPGDKIIIQTPVYHPFYSIINGNGRIIVENDLKLQDGRYVMNFEDLKSKIDDKVKMIILCNPHNPVGRVWSKEELRELGDICLANNIIILSDEIHSDVIYSPYRHVPIATISKQLSAATLTCMAPSKTFNIAGLNTSYMIIENENLRTKIQKALTAFGLGTGNLFGITALEAAYINGSEWLDELLVYLKKNVDYTEQFLKNNIPGIDLVKTEGTYLAWLDCRGLGMNEQELKDFMYDQAKVGVSMGHIFGTSGDGFVRLNIGCPKALLEEGLNRMRQAVVNRIG